MATGARGAARGERESKGEGESRGEKRHVTAVMCFFFFFGLELLGLSPGRSALQSAK